MKRTLLPLFFALTLVLTGCQDNAGKEAESVMDDLIEETDTSIKDVSLRDHSMDADDSWLSEIQLNEGTQWIANPETIAGVERMRKNIHTAGLNSTEAYHQLAEKLNEDKNYIVKECTMEGESHDNLHVWLHPLIEKIESLGKVANADEGQLLVDDIETRLTRFYEFFK